MRFAVILILAFLVVGPIYAYPGDAMTVRLHATASVSGRYFTLGDVAVVEGHDRDANEEMASTPIGVVPPIGYPITVSKERIQKLLMHTGTVDQRGVEWLGASAVVVRCSAKRYGMSMLLTKAHRKLARYLSSLVPDAVAINVTPINQRPDIELPDGAISISAYMGASAAISKRMVVWTDISIDGNRYETLPIWFDVSVVKPVLVLTADIPRQHVLESSDIKVADRDIAGLDGVTVPIDTDIASLRVKKGISADTVLLQRSVERKPLVERLKQVSVEVAVGSVEISTQGIAEAEGHAGDMIRIRNPHSNETYIAEVVGKDTVKVASH